MLYNTPNKKSIESLISGSLLQHFTSDVMAIQVTECAFRLSSFSGDLDSDSLNQSYTCHEYITVQRRK